MELTKETKEATVNSVRMISLGGDRMAPLLSGLRKTKVSREKAH